MQDYSNLLLSSIEKNEIRKIIKTGGVADEATVLIQEICVGMELGDTGIKIVVLKKSHLGIELLKWGIYEYPFQLNHSSLGQSAGALDTLISKMNIRGAKTALSMNNGMHLQYIEMPVISDKGFVARVRDYLGPNYVGNEHGDIYFSRLYGIIRDHSGAIVKHGVTVIADESYFNETIQLMKNQSVDLRRVESSCMALIDLFDIPMTFAEPYCLIDLGSSSVRISIVQNRKILFHRTVYSIDKYLTKELSEIYQIRHELAERIKKKMRFSGGDTDEQKIVEERIFEMTEPILCILVDEIKSTFRMFKHESGKIVNKLVLTGGGALISGLDKFLQLKLNVDVEIGKIRHKINLHESVDEKEFRLYASRLTSAIGAARNELINNDEHSINLFGDRMKSNRNLTNSVKVWVILFVILFTGLFIRNDLNMRSMEYKKNIQTCENLLGDLERRINELSDAQILLKTASDETRDMGRIKTSQILRKLGNNLPASLWLERMKIENEPNQTIDELVKVNVRTREKIASRKVFQFEGRSINKTAIRDFLHQIEQMSQWNKVTLKKIDWVGSSDDGIWEFTIQVIQ